MHIILWKFVAILFYLCQCSLCYQPHFIALNRFILCSLEQADLCYQLFTCMVLHRVLS